jgi:predicted phosphodiesterase
MRIAVIADIHGNFRALEAVLADIDQAGADHIVSLGDNIGYGPEPEEVVRTLIERQIDSVLGNHELALQTPRKPRKPRKVTVFSRIINYEQP